MENNKVEHFTTFDCFMDIWIIKAVMEFGHRHIAIGECFALWAIEKHFLLARLAVGECKIQEKTPFNSPLKIMTSAVPNTLV